ncbi:MAG: hypothetical protein ACI4GO_04295 [Hominenteromicrobium sp.]
MRKNEAVVLRPKRFELLLLWIALPWLMAAGMCLLSPGFFWADNRAKLFMLLILLLFNVFSLRAFFGAKICLEPDGKILYRELRMVRSDKVEADPAEQFHADRESPFRQMIHKSGRKGVTMKAVQAEFYAQDIRKFGYTQELFPDRTYLPWSRADSKRWLTFERAGMPLLDCRLTGFRKKQVEMLLDFIRRHNPRAEWIEK